ncbi:MAG: hypothetical protein V1672_01655 [Candidatus Diapherotrites archaeon]
MELGEKASRREARWNAKWARRSGFTGKSAKWKRKWDKWLEERDKKLEAE